MVAQTQQAARIDPSNVRPAAADFIDDRPSAIELGAQQPVAVAFPGDEAAARCQQRQGQFSNLRHRADCAGNHQRIAGAMLWLVGGVVGAAQELPPLVDRNTPPSVAAITVPPLAVRPRTTRVPGCVIVGVHVRPSSAERNTPW